MTTMITGGRNITNEVYIRGVLSLYNITKFLHGNAKGVDTISAKIMEDKCEVISYPADWKKYGRSAGFVRNSQMIKDTYAVIAIWDGKSKGTKDAIEQAIKNNKKLHVHLTSKVHLTTEQHLPDALDEEEVFKLLGVKLDPLASRYELLKSLKDNYNPLKPQGLLELNNKVIQSLNKEANYALATFLVDKVALIDDNFVPIFQNLDIYSKKMGGAGLISRVISNRIDKQNYKDIEDILNPNENNMRLLTSRHDRMDVAVNLLKETFSLSKEEYEVCLVTDSDADGTNSAALGSRYLKYKNISTTVLVNERRYGNGVNDYLVDEITKQYFKTGRDRKIFLIITADHGTADEERYQVLKALGDNVKILVTDHHLLPSDIEGNTLPPVSIDGFVNPQDPDSLLPPYISGCAVLFALFLNYEIDVNKLNLTQAIEELLFLMPYVTITTISDMMDLSKPLNRYFYKVGIEYIKQSRYGTWMVFKHLTKTSRYTVDTFSRGFVPYINSCNRMGVATKAYELLTCESEITAMAKFKSIKGINNSRRNLQKSLTKTIQDDIDSNYSVSLVLDSSALNPKQIKHASGVIGIVANSVGDIYGKPCFVFVRQGDTLKGSGRGIAKNVHLRMVIDYIKGVKPELVIGGGGHRYAAGISLNILKNSPNMEENVEDTINEFRRLFDEAIFLQNNGRLLLIDPVDVTLEVVYMTENLTDEISDLSPFGNGFLPPVFVTNGLVANFRQINKTMLSFKLIDKETGYRISCIAFQSTNFPKFGDGDHITVNGGINIDTYSSRAVIYVSGVI